MNNIDKPALIDWIDKNNGLVEKAIDLCEECKNDYVPIFDTFELINKINEPDQVKMDKRMPRYTSEEEKIDKAIESIKKKLLTAAYSDMLDRAKDDYFVKRKNFDQLLLELFDNFLKEECNLSDDDDAKKKMIASFVKDITDGKKLLVKKLKNLGKWNDVMTSEKWVKFEKLFYIKKVYQILNNVGRINIKLNPNNDTLWSVGYSIQRKSKSQSDDEYDYDEYDYDEYDYDDDIVNQSTILDQNFLQLMFLRQLIISDPNICNDLTNIMGFKIDANNDSSPFSKLFNNRDFIKDQLSNLGFNEDNIEKILKFMTWQSFMNIRRSIIEVVAVIMLMRYEGQKANKCYWKYGQEMLTESDIQDIFQKVFQNRDIKDNYLKTVIMMTITSCAISSSEKIKPLYHMTWIPDELLIKDDEYVETGNCNIYSYFLSLMLEDNNNLKINDYYKWIIYLIKECYINRDFITFSRYIGVLLYSSSRFDYGNQRIHQRIEAYKYQDIRVRKCIDINDSLVFNDFYIKNFEDGMRKNSVLYESFIKLIDDKYGKGKFGELDNKCILIGCKTNNAKKSRDINNVCNGELIEKTEIEGHALVLMNTKLSLLMKEDELIKKLPLNDLPHSEFTLMSIKACMRLYNEYNDKKAKNNNKQVLIPFNEDEYEQNVEKFNSIITKKMLEINKRKEMNKIINMLEEGNKTGEEKWNNKKNMIRNKVSDETLRKLNHEFHKNKSISSKLFDRIKNELQSHYSQYEAPEDDDYFINLFMDLNRCIMYQMFALENVSTLWLLIDPNAYYLISGTIMDIFCSRPTTYINRLKKEKTFYSLQVYNLFNVSFLDHEMKPIDLSFNSNYNKIQGSGIVDENEYLKRIMTCILFILLVIVVVSLIVVLVRRIEENERTIGQINS